MMMWRAYEEWWMHQTFVFVWDMWQENNGSCNLCWWRTCDLCCVFRSGMKSTQHLKFYSWFTNWVWSVCGNMEMMNEMSICPTYLLSCNLYVKASNMSLYLDILARTSAPELARPSVRSLGSDRGREARLRDCCSHPPGPGTCPGSCGRTQTTNTTLSMFSQQQLALLWTLGSFVSRYSQLTSKIQQTTSARSQSLVNCLGMEWKHKPLDSKTIFWAPGRWGHYDGELLPNVTILKQGQADNILLLSPNKWRLFLFLTAGDKSRLST